MVFSLFPKFIKSFNGSKVTINAILLDGQVHFSLHLPEWATCLVTNGMLSLKLNYMLVPGLS